MAKFTFIYANIDFYHPSGNVLSVIPWSPVCHHGAGTEGGGRGGVGSPGRKNIAPKSLHYDK